MTDDAAVPPLDRFDRASFFTSGAVLIGSLWFWLLCVASPHRAVYDSLGMKVLPIITEGALTMARLSTGVLPILTLALVLFGLVAYRRADPLFVKRLTLINWIAVGLLPMLMHAAIQAPIMTLQRKLAGG